jgi:muramoyltetrapeptide carboxypeptidase
MTAFLEGMSYRVHTMPHAFERDAYLAGSDEVRAQDLQSAFADPEVHAVLCTRGGYGTARLMPYLDIDAIVASEKLFLGYSDVTTLHMALQRRGYPSVYAPMSITFSDPREEWVYESFRRALTGNTEIPAEAPSGTTLVGGTVEGVVVGGCLCLITDSLGTPEALPAEGAIVVIEDVDEAPHRVDAMLTHLLNSGAADAAVGFVVGEMTRTDDRIDQGIGGKPWRDIVRDRLAPLGKPLIIEFPFGHMKQMLTLPLGVRARLDADAGRLTYLESHVQ